MAFLDDRSWCHPKVVGLSDRAFRVWVQSIAYSSGMLTRGHLTDAQQKLVGATPKIREELLGAGLWDLNGDGVVIHEWEEKNGRRDDRRERERRRKQEARRSGRWNEADR